MTVEKALAELNEHGFHIEQIEADKFKVYDTGLFGFVTEEAPFIVDGDEVLEIYEKYLKKILFCVMFTSRDDWDSPTVVFVNATDRDKAYFAALKKIGYTEEEADEMREEGFYDDVIIEVDDIIDEDYEPTEET